MPAGSRSCANRVNANRSGRTSGSRGSGSSSGRVGAVGKYMTHKGGDSGRVTKVEKTPSGDTTIEITKSDGTTHRDYATYFE